MSDEKVERLLDKAERRGDMSPETRAILERMGIDPDIIEVEPVPELGYIYNDYIFVVIQPDDSKSIRFSKQAQTMRDGHNAAVEAFKDAMKVQRDAILLKTQYLNGEVLNDWVELDKAQHMTEDNYDPEKGTPLYDNAVAILTEIMVKVQQLKDKGMRARAAVLFVTDAKDEHSTKCTAGDVCKLVSDLLAKNTDPRNPTYVVAFMGIGDDEQYFVDIAHSMGIYDLGDEPINKRILTPGNDAQEVRRAFVLYSKNATRAFRGGSVPQGKLGGGFVEDDE